MSLPRVLFLAATFAHVASGIALGSWQNRGGRPSRVASSPELVSYSMDDDDDDSAYCTNERAGADPWNLDGKPFGDKLEPYRRLFAKWDKKNVVFAGDSLIRGIWLTIGCAANLLNGTTITSMAETITPNRHGVDIHAISQPNNWRFMDEKLHTHLKEIAATHGQIQVSVDGLQFTMHFYYYFYALGSDAYQAKVDAGREDLMIPNTVLVSMLQKYDFVYLNIGHAALRSSIPQIYFENNDSSSSVTISERIDAFSRNEAQPACQSHFKAFIDLVHNAKLPATFIEHPPSHFDTPDGDSDEAGSGVCKCQPLETLKKQFNYQCERGSWMSSYLKDKPTIRTANWFEGMADLCNNHVLAKEGDCRHFDDNPLLHADLVEHMAKLLE